MLIKGWRNKNQQGSLYRSFSECNHARVVISEIMNVIASQVRRHGSFFRQGLRFQRLISIQVFQGSIIFL